MNDKVEVGAFPITYVIPEPSLKARFPDPAVALPKEIVVADGCWSVPAKPLQSSDLPVEDADIVTVPELELSKKTSSAAVGTAAPPSPPEVLAYLVPAVASHVAVPPTQKRLAMNVS